jgi:hypothetical protein
MNKSIYVSVRELPETIKQVLKSLEYGAKDIAVEISDTFHVFCSANDGQRAFTIVANIATGEFVKSQGSWGGENAFVTTQVDTDDRIRPLLEGFAVIQGTTGYPRTLATIIINHANVVKMLPEKQNITNRQKDILYQFVAYKPSYRNKYPESEINELIDMGMLKRSKSGALSITTAGKNLAR